MFKLYCVVNRGKVGQLSKKKRVRCSSIYIIYIMSAPLSSPTSLPRRWYGGFIRYIYVWSPASLISACAYILICRVQHIISVIFS